MADEEDRILQIFYIAAFVFVAAGVVCGALYYVNKCMDSGDIKNYMGSYVTFLQNGVDSKSVMLRSMKLNALTAGILIFGATFRVGIVLIVYEVLRRGFISGFTAAAFIGTYGGKGIVMSLCMMTQAVLLIPAMCAFASLNGALSLRKLTVEKNFIIFYIIFLLIIVTIFCGSSVCEGYLTTIFMRIAAKSVT